MRSQDVPRLTPAEQESQTGSFQPLIAGIVILFHPDLKQLRQLYDGVRDQVDSLWFIDNTPGLSGERFEPEADQPAWDVNYHPLGENKGIAAAQNVGMRRALASGFDHVLLLDQDSLLPPATVSTLLAAEHTLLHQGVQVAAVGPVFLDDKTFLPSRVHHHVWFWLHKPPVDLKAMQPLETDWLIASGSLIRSCVLSQTGLMREELFIDAVDMEWGLRAKSLGLQSFVAPTAQISHNVGDSFGKLLGVSVILHGELRNYYIARNWLYLLRVPSMGSRWRTGAIVHVAKFLLVHMWFSRRRISQLGFFGRAMRDGIFGRMGRYKM